MKGLAKGLAFLYLSAGKFPSKRSVGISGRTLAHAENPLVAIKNYGAHHIVMLHICFG